MRYIPISVCNDCPNAKNTNRGPFCLKANKPLEVFSEMPEWCPLPERDGPQPVKKETERPMDPNLKGLVKKPSTARKKPKPKTV